jgi:phage terminase large subunit-like protein
MTSPTSALFWACLASTWFLTGLIWFVQVVHYPLFAAVPPEAFGAYHARHTRTTTSVVVVPMLVELLTSAALLAWRPAWMSREAAVAGLILAALVWASTAGVQVPLHARLSRGRDAAAIRRLVRTNAARAALWTAHALLLLAVAARGGRPA